MIGHVICAGILGRIAAHRRLVFTVRADGERRVGEDPFQHILVVN